VIVMFAPCFLGCRGTARQRPVSDGTGFRGPPYSSKRHSILRHYPTRLNWLSSGLLIRGYAAVGRAIDADRGTIDRRSPCERVTHAHKDAAPIAARLAGTLNWHNLKRGSPVPQLTKVDVEVGDG
jgi:hypothetical protein